MGPVTHMLRDHNHAHHPQAAEACDLYVKNVVSKSTETWRVCYIRLQVSLKLYPCHCSSQSAWDSLSNRVWKGYSNSRVCWHTGKRLLMQWHKGSSEPHSEHSSEHITAVYWRLPLQDPSLATLIEAQNWLLLSAGNLEVQQKPLSTQESSSAAGRSKKILNTTFCLELLISKTSLLVAVPEKTSQWLLWTLNSRSVSNHIHTSLLRNWDWMQPP